MLFRLAVTVVLCSNEALSHEDEDYKLGDSSGCDAGFVQVRDQWECFAAPDRVNSFTIGISTTGDQRGADYLSYGLTSGKGNSKSGYASPGCGYLRQDAAKSPSNDKNSEMTYFNTDTSGSYIGNEDEWNIPPLPYCKRNGSQLQQNEVLFLGDIDIDNWRTTSESFPGSYNVGWAADCKGLKWRLDNLMQAFEPSVVVLACGEKDLDDGVSVRKTYRRFKKITDKLMSHHASVVYLGTRPEPQKTKQQHARYRNYDSFVERLVRRLAKGEDMHDHDEKTLRMIDVYDNFMRAGNPRNLYAFDGMRLSEAGYKLWTSWTQKALDDSTCIVWGDDKCKRRRKMSPSRRATMVIGSPEEIIV